MTTIYIVTDGSYSDYGIRSVFSSKERAQAYIDERCKSGDIEEWGLDDWLDERQQGLKFYSVHMQLTGDGAKVKEDEPPSCYQNGWIGRPLNGHMPDWFAMTIWAKDAEHALKIANDRRREKIANGDKN